MNNDEFERFVLKFGKDILRFCRMTAGDAENGNELYQDTMLKLLEKRNRLDSMHNTKSYALSTSIYLWKNRKKKYANRVVSNFVVPADFRTDYSAVAYIVEYLGYNRGMACSTGSRADHYGCSICFSSSEQREVSLRIKEDVHAVWRLIKKPLCGGKIIMRQNRIPVSGPHFFRFYSDFSFSSSRSAMGVKIWYFFQIKYIFVSSLGVRGRKTRPLSELVSIKCLKVKR